MAWRLTLSDKFTCYRYQLHSIVSSYCNHVTDIYHLVYGVTDILPVFMIYMKNFTRLPLMIHKLSQDISYILDGKHHDVVGIHKNINTLKSNDPYRGRSAPLTSKRCILYIYSTNIGTEYFKHGIYSPFFFPLQNAVCFIILTHLVPVLFTFYIQDVLKLKKK